MKSALEPRSIGSETKYRIIMWLLTKMVIFLTMYFVGLLIMFNYPEEHRIGIILSFGGLLLFGLTLAQAHIKSLE
jgi:hypothetical protein